MRFTAPVTFCSKALTPCKVICSDLAGGNDPELVTRFRQEAIATAAIRHPNVVAVTDFGVARGNLPFIVMDYIHGRTLQSYLEEKGSLAPDEAFEITSAIGAGVGAAHRLGIVHRDLKPLNIMLQEDLPLRAAVKVLDFGLAKIKSDELLGSFIRAQTSGLMGSPFYMAPEQWSDEEPDARADIYSLGVILFQMLTGDVPFKGPSLPAIMKKHLLSPPPAMNLQAARVPAAVEAVVRRALEKSPSDRPPSVEVFLAELRAAIGPKLASRPSLRVVRPADVAVVVGGKTSAAATYERSAPPATSPSKFMAARRPDKVLIAGACFCVLLLLLLASTGMSVYLEWLGSSVRRETAAVVAVAFPRVTPVPLPAETAAEAAPLMLPGNLVGLPAGVFAMGRKEGTTEDAGRLHFNEMPRHKVIVSAFAIDRTEVTKDEYSRFVRETGHALPRGWPDALVPAAESQFPVTGVSLEDVNSFAAWRSRRDKVSYRLPTEEEWEYAARSGSDEFVFPWGNEWQKD